MHGVILECLLVHAALGIPIRLVLAQVSKHCKDVIDASWFQLVTRGVMHALYTELGPRCVKTFVKEQHGYWQANDWVIHMENDGSSCFAKVVEYEGMFKWSSLAATHRFYLNVSVASVFGKNKKEGLIEISLYRKGESRRIVLLKKTRVDLTDYDDEYDDGKYECLVTSDTWNDYDDGVRFEFYYGINSSETKIFMSMSTKVLQTVIGDSAEQPGGREPLPWTRYLRLGGCVAMDSIS